MRCRKRGYPSRVEAMIALASTQAAAIRHRKHHKQHDRQEQRVYKCQCGRWHLTSMPAS